MRVLLQGASIAMGLGVLLQGSFPALVYFYLQHAVSAARITALSGGQRASCVQALTYSARHQRL